MIDEISWMTSVNLCEMAFYSSVFQCELKQHRKGRLLICACCRRRWDYLPDPRSQAAVEIAERRVDGAAEEEDIQNASTEAWVAREMLKEMKSLCEAFPNALEEIGYRNYAGNLITPTSALSAADWAAEAIKDDSRIPMLPEDGVREMFDIAIARDIFGNPFRPVTVDPQWLTSDVLALARGIYDERAFDRMPILADALQDAGCDSGAVLDHCRDPNGVHVRGCWVVDLLLGKS